MWPIKRKQKNRRLGRPDLLEVKLRSSGWRGVRMRWGAMAFAVSFGLLFGLYLVWRSGEWALNRFIYENKTFAIQQIEVLNDGEIAPDQIRRWSGVKAGQNLLALNLAVVKRDLELAPNIQAASVERILPRTLRVRVIEREPLLQVYVPQPRPDGGYDMALLYLDEEGCVMPPLDPRQRAAPPSRPPDQYPVVAGIKFTEMLPGRRLESPQIRAALQLVTAFDRSPMVGVDELRRIDVSSPEILQVTTAQGSQISFSVRDLDRQLRRWREIFELGQRMGKGIATLDLSVPNNIPATWLENSVVPPAAPKFPKPSRSRRNNV